MSSFKAEEASETILHTNTLYSYYGDKALILVFIFRLHMNLLSHFPLDKFLAACFFMHVAAVYQLHTFYTQIYLQLGLHFLTRNLYGPDMLCFFDLLK